MAGPGTGLCLVIPYWFYLDGFNLQILTKYGKKYAVFFRKRKNGQINVGQTTEPLMWGRAPNVGQSS